MRKKKPAPIFHGCVDTVMLVCLCLIFSPVMLYLGVKTMVDDQALQTEGRKLNARITALNHSAGGSSAVYEVKYSFTPDGINWYSCADQTFRRDLWCPVTPEQYQQAEKSRLFEVVYVPRNPWINRPGQSSTRTFDSVAGICLGILPWVILLWIILSRRSHP
jgi:hypothetical protein